MGVAPSHGGAAGPTADRADPLLTVACRAASPHAAHSFKHAARDTAGRAAGKRRNRARNVKWAPRRAYDPAKDLASLPVPAALPPGKF